MSDGGFCHYCRRSNCICDEEVERNLFEQWVKDRANSDMKNGFDAGGLFLDLERAYNGTNNRREYRHEDTYAAFESWKAARGKA